MNKTKTLNENDVLEHEGKVLEQLGIMLNGRYGTHSMADITYSIRYLNELRTDLAKMLKLADLVSQLMDVHPMTDEPISVMQTHVRYSTKRRGSLTKGTQYFLSASQIRELTRAISSTVSEIAHVSKQLQRDAERLEGLIKKQSSA